MFERLFCIHSGLILFYNCRLQAEESTATEVQTKLKQLHSRNSELRKNIQQFYEAYRSLRYLYEDTVPTNNSDASTVVHEDEVIGESEGEFLQSTDNGGYGIKRMSMAPPKVQVLKGAINLTKRQLERTKPSRTSQDVLKFENERLRSELDRLRPDFTHTPLHQIRAENSELKAKVRTRLQQDHIVEMHRLAGRHALKWRSGRG